MFAVCQTRFYTLPNFHRSLRTQHFHLPTLPAHPCCCHQSVSRQKRLTSCASDITVLLSHTYPAPTLLHRVRYCCWSYTQSVHRVRYYCWSYTQSVHRVRYYCWSYTEAVHRVRYCCWSYTEAVHRVWYNCWSYTEAVHRVWYNCWSYTQAVRSVRYNCWTSVRLSTVSGITVGFTLSSPSLSRTKLTVSGITGGLTLSPPSLSRTKLTGCPPCRV